MPSPLSFASTESFRNQLMAKNLAEYTVQGFYSPQTGPLNYETILGDSNVIDSPNNLNASNPNSYYPINEFGPEGGYSLTISYNNVQSNGPNVGPYLDSFLPSTYTPYSILFSSNPTGSDGNLSQDSFIAKLGAKNLKLLFEERIATEIYQSTVGVVNLQSLQDPFQAALIATGQQPLIYRNWRITVPENPILAAVDFATRITGSYWPVSFIPGDYFEENENNGLPTSQTSGALSTVNQLTGGLLGPILNLKRNPSQIFLANTGNGQKSALFANLYYNRYKPNYDSSYGGPLGAVQGLVNAISNIVNPNGTVTSSYYVGSPNSEPENITSPANQVPVNSRGKQTGAIVYGPDELGKLFEGNIEQIRFGLGNYSNDDKVGVDGLFVWTSPKYKNNAGFHPVVGGAAGSKDDEFNIISSNYQRNESTNVKLKQDSILDNTQKLINSADNVTGPTRLKHVGNAINQVSKVFNDGYKEMTKGSKVVSYTDNTTGAEAGVEYCRVFAKDTPYYTYADLQKTDGITTAGRQFSYSVLDNTYNLNIAPFKNPGSTNIFPDDSEGRGGYVKKYMFSIENLAWRTSGRDGFKYDDLPVCERGPNGGRIMWFPPYDLKFSDQSQANWSPTNFLGRPEPIYTYKDTSRSGSLSWKMVVDHPSILNVIVDKQLKGANSERVNSIIESFFAGCVKFDLYALAAKFNKIPVSELQQIQNTLNNPRLTPEELSTLKQSIPADNTTVVNDTANNTGGGQNTAVTPDPAIAKFNEKYKDLGFYFDNDIPKGNNVNFEGLYNSYISQSNITKYKNNSASAFEVGDINTLTDSFFDLIKENYNEIAGGTDNFITDAYRLLNENIASAITITMIGSASATASVSYNKSLSERRISSVKQFFKEKTIGEANLGKFMKEGAERFKVVSSKAAGEEIVIPLSQSGNAGEPINCTEDISGLTGSNNITQVYSLSAMACRRVRIEGVKAEAKTPEPVKVDEQKKDIKTNEVTITPLKPTPNVDVAQSLKQGLSKKVLRALLSECDYFEMVKESNPMVYSSFKEKIKYFDPAFHSMTPEGLNSRLTFLNQCVRPGETIPIIGPDGKPKYNDALNTSFGTPPVLVLRIGDFYHCKIIPNSVSFSYEPLLYDMNPEGIGVQPMIADVQMSFNIIGGMGLKEPVEQLQNALSFNFYANTEIYDERATATEDTSALDKKVFDAIVANSGNPGNQVKNNQQQNKGGNTIGEELIFSPVDGGTVGEMSYQKVMDKLLDTTKEYFTNTINQLEKVQEQYNYGTVQLLNDINTNPADNPPRQYQKAFINGKDTNPGLYGKPQITKTDDLFKAVIDEINNTNTAQGSNPLIAYVIDKVGLTSTSNEIIVLKQNMIQYVEKMKGDYDTGLTTIIQEIVAVENNLITLINQLNLVVTQTDGKIVDGQTPKVYNISGATDAGYVVTPNAANTLQELKNDYENFRTGITEYIVSLQKNDIIVTTDPFDVFDLSPFFKGIEDGVDNKKFFMVMARVLSDKNKKQDFINFVLSPNITTNNKVVKYFNKKCDELDKAYTKELKRELKIFEKYKKSPDYKKFTDGITEVLYTKGKPRKFKASTVKIEATNAQQETDIKNIYGSVNFGDKANDKSTIQGKISI